LIAAGGTPSACPRPLPSQHFVHPLRHQGGGRADARFVKEDAAGRRIEVEFQRLRTAIACGLHESGGGIDGPAGTDRHEQIGMGDRAVDPIHLIRHFTEEDDVGPQFARHAAGAAAAVVVHLPLERHARIANLAPCAFQRAMHVQYIARTGTPVQIVHILRHDQHIAMPLPFKRGQRQMRGIGLYRGERRAAHVIEAPHQRRIAGKRFGRADILHPVPFPQAAGTAKSGDAGFGADSRAGQNHDVANSGHARQRAWSKGDDKSMTTRIGLIGAGGRMGRAIAAVAGQTAGAAIVGGVDRTAGGSEIAPGIIIGTDPAALAPQCDVLVDFSSPAALDANLAAARATGTSIVIGTTGLGAEHHALIDDAARDIAVLQAANTSLGVNLVAHLVREAAARLGPDWDIEVLEMHHRHKVDAPSGTALYLGTAAAEGRDVALDDVADKVRDGITGPRKEGAIGFAVLRGGSVAGDHQVIFAGEGERIEIGHRAETREIFARGAVKAALWLAGQAKGRYRMADVLGLGA